MNGGSERDGWFRSAEWQAGDAEAERDIAAGRVTVVRSVEEMDAALDADRTGLGAPDGS